MKKKDSEPCMLFEQGGIKNSKDIRFNYLKKIVKGETITIPFTFRLAKGCIYRYWNADKNECVDFKVVQSFTNMANNRKHLIELQKL